MDHEKIARMSLIHAHTHIKHEEDEWKSCVLIYQLLKIGAITEDELHDIWGNFEIEPGEINKLIDKAKTVGKKMED